MDNDAMMEGLFDQFINPDFVDTLQSDGVSPKSIQPPCSIPRNSMALPADMPLDTHTSNSRFWQPVNSSAYTYGTPAPLGSYDSLASPACHHRPTSAEPYNSYTSAGMHDSLAPAGFGDTMDEQMVDFNDNPHFGFAPITATEVSQAQSNVPIMQPVPSKVRNTNRRMQKTALAHRHKNVKTDLRSSNDTPEFSPSMKVDTPMSSNHEALTAEAKAKSTRKGGRKMDAVSDPINQLIFDLTVYDRKPSSAIAQHLKDTGLWPSATVAMVYGRFKRNAPEQALLDGLKNFNVYDYGYKFGRDAHGNVIERRAPGSKDRLGEWKIETTEDQYLFNAWLKVKRELWYSVAREMKEATGQKWTPAQCAERLDFISGGSY